ncbi:MAG TPA: hypothetical protein VH370_16490 [Humisphaera sp.]|jgi:hypothetical protein|nr:hypothetical protein [Humisphaera sp.]
MKTLEAQTTRELFASVGEGGVRWMFSLLPDGVWEITRNSTRVDAGPTAGRALLIGLEKFLTLSRSSAGKAACDPVVQKHVDWIEDSIEQEARGEATIGMPARDSYSTFAALPPYPTRRSKANRKLQTQMKDLP